MIRTERIEFALRHLPSTAGWDFERFCNAFLTSEIPYLRPVGGIHDGGRDAFIYSSNEEESTFVQYSVTVSWEQKIRDTVKALKENGHNPSELVFCSNQEIQTKATKIKSELRKDKISLDIRDLRYFVAAANNSQGTLAAAEEIAEKHTDPIFAQQVTGNSIAPPDTDAESKAVLASLYAELVEREDGKSLEKIGLEALLEYSLREADSDNPKARSQIHADFIRVIRTYPEDIVRQKVDGLLSRLTGKGGKIKHHSQADAFTLEYSERLRIADRHIEFESLRATAYTEAEGVLTAIIADLKIDYPVQCSEFLKDAFLIAQAFLYDRAEKSVEAITNSDFTGIALKSIPSFIENKISDASFSLNTRDGHSRAEITDILPELVDRILSKPESNIRKYLGKVTRTYEFLFVIQEVKKIQESLGRRILSCKLLLDSNIIIPCLCDYLKNPDDRPSVNVLKQSVECGTKLFVTTETITELCTSLFTAQAIHASVVSGNSESTHNELVNAYIGSTHHGYSSFGEFIETFAGRYNAQKDLSEFLSEELGVETDDFLSTRNEVDLDEVERLWPVLLASRPNRKGYTEERMQELSRNDATLLLISEKLRAKHSSEPWWLLTRDKRLQQLDHDRISKGAVSLTMNPNYFIKYLGLYRREDDGTLPLVFEMSERGFVPDELTEGLAETMAQIKDLPPYMQRRKMRDLGAKLQATRTN